MNEMTVRRLLKPARHRFRELGTHLGVSPDSMNAFQAYKGNAKDCLLAVIELWYKESPSKERLMEALETLDKLRLKKELTTQYDGIHVMGGWGGVGGR